MISFIGLRQDRNPRSEDFLVKQVRMRKRHHLDPYPVGLRGSDGEVGTPCLRMADPIPRRAENVSSHPR
jgi:hypothetical protein